MPTGLGSRPNWPGGNPSSRRRRPGSGCCRASDHASAEQLHGAAVRPHPGPPGIVIQDDAASEAQLRECAMARGLHPRER